MSITDCYCFPIIGVYRVTRKAGFAANPPRSLSALALRISGESHFNANGTCFTADAGSILYIPPGIAFTRDSTEEELIVIHFQCPCKDPVPSCSYGTSPEVLHPSDILQAFTCFSEIHREWEEKDPGFLHRCTAKLHLLFASLEESNRRTFSSDKLLLIKPGIDYIETHFDDPGISISRLAQLCHISEKYFRKLYKEAFEISPLKAITERRLQKACRLLQSGYFSVQETAELSGFRNQKYFSSLFHETIGMTPSAYISALSSMTTATVSIQEH